MAIIGCRALQRNGTIQDPRVLPRLHQEGTTASAGIRVPWKHCVLGLLLLLSVIAPSRLANAFCYTVTVSGAGSSIVNGDYEIESIGHLPGGRPSFQMVDGTVCIWYSAGRWILQDWYGSGLLYYSNPADTLLPPETGWQLDGAGELAVPTLSSSSCSDPIILAQAQSGGSIDPSGTVTVSEGADQTFVITPDTGYVIADVRVDNDWVGAVASYTFTDVTIPHRIYATFLADLAPVLTIPPDITIDCDESCDPANTGQATATDDHDPNPVVTYTDQHVSGGACASAAINRTWTATDSAGNFTTGVQTICYARPGHTITASTSGWVTTLPATVYVTFTYEQCAYEALVYAKPLLGTTGYWGDYTPIVSDGITENTVTVTLPSGAPEGSYRLQQINLHFGTLPDRLYWTMTDRVFGVDLTPPTDPVVSSTTHTVDTWSNDPAVAIAISGATDAVSGVDGFEVAWDQNATWTPTHTKTHEETWSGDTFTATAEGDWYFHLATVDNAGNCTGTVHLGPFKIRWESSITNIQFSPPSPAGFCYGWDERLTITFDYSTDYPGGVRIWTLPFTGGSSTQDFRVSGSIIYPTGSGSGDDFFFFDVEHGPRIVDQVRYQMWSLDHSVLLEEVFVDVDFRWGPLYETTPPVLTIPPDITINCDDSDHPDVTGWATVTDTCDPNPTLTYSDQYGYASLGLIIRTWRAEDAAGNFVEAEQRISIACPEVNVVSHSPEWVTSLPSTVEISFTFEKCATRGAAYVQQTSPVVEHYWGNWASITSDGHTVNTLTVDLPSDAGEGTYKWRTILGLNDSFSRHMVYSPNLEFGVDTIAPAITSFSASALDDGYVNAAEALGFDVTFTATDAGSGVYWGKANLDLYSQPSTYINPPVPSHTFTFTPIATGAPDGLITQYVSAQDRAGNLTVVTAYTVIKDTTPPTIINCPRDISVVSLLGETSVAVNWVEPTGEDLGSGIQSFTSTHHPGDIFQVGTTEVTYTAEDNAGNVTTCSFSVAVGSITLPRSVAGEEGVPGSILTAPILLDPEDAPMIGDYPLAATCGTGDPLGGALVLQGPDGRPLRGCAIILYLYKVDLTDETPRLTLLDHWSVQYDIHTRNWHFEIATEGLKAGYYYIYLSCPGGSTITLPVEITYL